MAPTRKTVVAREWIIFALSFGLGGHIALGFMLHNSTPERWQAIGWKAVFFGLFVYIAVQVGRSIFLAIRASRGKRNA
jgi:hypothetical protein